MFHVLSIGLVMNATGKAYEGLGRWYRVENEIEDILCFLQDRVGLPVKDMPSRTNAYRAVNEDERLNKVRLKYLKLIRVDIKRTPLSFVIECDPRQQKNQAHPGSQI